jgi:hypothetical protein
MQAPTVTIPKVTNFLVVNRCNGQSTDGLYRIDIAVSARRHDLNQEFLITGTEGLALRYDIGITLQACP